MDSFWEFLKNEFSLKTAIFDVFTFGMYGTLKLWEKYFDFKPKRIDQNFDEI